LKVLLGGNAWGFRVAKSTYDEAWNQLMNAISGSTSSHTVASSNSDSTVIIMKEGDTNLLDDLLTEKEVQRMKVAELKEQLKKRSQPLTGLKAELAARLIACISRS
jgi:hypothetical protein